MSRNSKSIFSFNKLAQCLALSGLMAAGAATMAQGTTPAETGSGPRSEHMSKHDPAKMHAMMAKHQADLKAKLKLTPVQEGAWTAFTAAMRPSASMGMHPVEARPAEMDKLTTPERIDKMRAMRTERMAQMTAEMDKRGNATKTFYATLTPEQQKVFDAEHQKRGAHGEHDGHGGPERQKS